jgi:hypothetical protein
LAIVAGASHAFKNLLTPLRGGLQTASVETSALQVALRVYKEITREPVTGHDLPPLHSHDILRCVRHIPL